MLSPINIQRCMYYLRLKSLTNIVSVLPARNARVLHFCRVKKYCVLNSFCTYSDKPLSLLVRESSFPSRHHPPSVTESLELRLFEKFDTVNCLTVEEWTTLKNDFKDNFLILSDENFDSIVMNCLLIKDKIELAYSFMNYLKSINMKPNFLTSLKYMSLCSRHIDSCGQDVILETLKTIKSFIDSLPVLDKKVIEYIVSGLCATREWRTSFEYLKKLPQKPSIETRNTLACAALKNNDEPLAWRIITKWFKKEEIPNSQVLQKYILFVHKLQMQNPHMSDTIILKLFKYIEKKEIIVDQDVIKLIAEFFKRHRDKWEISYSKINRDGECSACENSLRLIDLTPNEFDTLRKSFLERSVKKTDIFINTTEKEFQQFINFIERHKPFHIVLDGLNAAHTYQGMKTNKALANHLLKIVTSLSQHSRRILILGRYHINYWPKPIMQKISRKAMVFLTNNISQDDPFTIYAALASGPHTLFVSLDLMRDHLSRLDDPNLIQLFRRWQRSHQIYISTDEANNLKLTGPLKHSIKIQCSMDDGWHIPYDDKVMLEPYEELNNWLCVKKFHK